MNQIVLLYEKESAQTKTTSGIIFDQNGVPLGKATIKAKGGQRSATSGANGQFRLAIPQNTPVLEISYEGMKPMDVSIEGKQSILVTPESNRKQTERL